MSFGLTPNSCSSTPRVHNAAVCWYSGTPTRLPLRSAGFSMPDLRLTKIVVWKNSRVVKIGKPTKRVSPCPGTIMNDEHDISDTANSAKCNCRQNSSDGCRTVGIRSMPSGFTVPSRIGQVRGLLVMPMLNCRFMWVLVGGQEWDHNMVVCRTMHG